MDAMQSYNPFLLFKIDMVKMMEYQQQIKTFRLKHVFLAKKIIRTARSVVKKLSDRYPHREMYEQSFPCFSSRSDAFGGCMAQSGWSIFMMPGSTKPKPVTAVASIRGDLSSDQWGLRSKHPENGSIATQQRVLCH
jgi:hypothetical protein